MYFTHIHKLLDNVTDISFTTDIWSLDVSQMSMLSLTAQWIDDSFGMKRAVLCAQEFAGLHTVAAITSAFDCMFAQWKIKKTTCTLCFTTMHRICRRQWTSVALKAWAAWRIRCS